VFAFKWQRQCDRQRAGNYSYITVCAQQAQGKCKNKLEWTETAEPVYKSPRVLPLSTYYSYCSDGINCVFPFIEGLCPFCLSKYNFLCMCPQTRPVFQPALTHTSSSVASALWRLTWVKNNLWLRSSKSLETPLYRWASCGNHPQLHNKILKTAPKTLTIA